MRSNFRGFECVVRAVIIVNIRIVSLRGFQYLLLITLIIFSQLLIYTINLADCMGGLFVVIFQIIFESGRNLPN